MKNYHATPFKPDTLKYWQQKADDDQNTILRLLAKVARLESKGDKVLVDKSLLVNVFNDYSKPEVSKLSSSIIQVWLEGKHIQEEMIQK